MQNEIFFLSHILLVGAFLMGALRWGPLALQGLIAIQAVLANLFVIKQIDLFGFSATCSDVFAIGATVGLNLIQEYWGPREAKRAINLSFLTLIFFTCMSQIHLLYLPNSADVTDISFLKIFSQTPRITLASIAVYLIVQRIDISLFSRLKSKFGGKYLPLRMGISLLLTQFLDTALFTVLGLWGIVDSLFDIFLVSFTIKSIVIWWSSAITTFSKRFVRHVPL